MPGLVPGIHVFRFLLKTWMDGQGRANGSGPKWPADHKLRDAVL